MLTRATEKDPDLAVLDPSRCATLLAFDANRFGAFFTKAGLVEHQHRVWMS